LETLHDYDWEEAVGVGVVLGFNRLRALDIDGCEDFELIEDFLNILAFPSNYKWVIQSGSKKGFHILFYSDNHKFRVLKNKVKAFKSNSDFNDVFKHVELRWIGHLVLPPSLHPSSSNYQFLYGFPLDEPLEISLDNIYELLNIYCSGKSLKESINVSGVYIEEDDDKNEESINVSGVYIEEDDDEDDEESINVSGIYIEEDDQEDAESINVSGVYIEEDASPYYLFFDTETTGVPNDWNAPATDLENWPRLVQLAYLLYDSNGKLILSSENIIKPSGFSIPKDASDVHGITTEYARENGKEIDEVLLDFEEQCLKSDFLVAHNINFDSKIIGSEFLRSFNRNPITKLHLLCTMESSTDYCKIQGFYGYKWPKLSELHSKLFGEDFEGSHDALADIEATARCFWEMRKLRLI
jgi:DNA polymerase III epsilon subunit-like protein